MADNADHFFYYNGITSALRTASDAARLNTYNPTHVNTFNEMNGLSSTTDAVLFDEDYTGEYCGSKWIEVVNGSGLVGATVCQSLSLLACQRFDLHFDTDYMGPRSEAAERSLACHEIGHSLGLLHNSLGGCMKPGFHTETHLGHEIPDHLNWDY